MNVAVVGGGSWGTTLAHLVGENDHQVIHWLRDEEVVQQINFHRSNPKYRPEVSISTNVSATSDIREVAQCKLILIAVPSHALREIAYELGNHLDGSHMLVHGIKGLEPETFKRMSAILKEETPCKRIGVISGPNLAEEIIKGHPSATVVASNYADVIESASAALRSTQFRVYGHDDPIGVELGGALKNIVAIASGMGHGMGFGDNTKAMLLTRGMAEIARLGVHMGAQFRTFGGLSGIGDLMATCFSPLSRNFRVGYRLARGEKLGDITRGLKQVAEGLKTAKTVHEYASRHQIYMPITEAVYHVTNHGMSPHEAISGLMALTRSAYEFD